MLIRLLKTNSVIILLLSGIVYSIYFWYERKQMLDFVQRDTFLNQIESNNSALLSDLNSDVTFYLIVSVVLIILVAVAIFLKIKTKYDIS